MPPRAYDASLEAMHKYYDHPVLPISAELDACSQKSDTFPIKRLPMNRDKLRTYPLPFPGSEKAVDWFPAFLQKEDQKLIVQRQFIKILSTDSNLQKSQSYELQLHPALRKQSPYPKRV